MRLADFLLQQLAAWGVERIYGVIGDAIFTLADALAQQSRIQFIGCRHEAAAGFMASAEAKLTGRPGVCIATSGPGVANLVNGLGDAALDRSPVLAITGQSPTDQLGTRYKQDVDQQLMLAALAHYSALLTAPAALPEMLRLAWRGALAGGVGHLSIPKNLFAAPMTGLAVQGPEPWLLATPEPSADSIATATAKMNAAKRPIIIAGHGALHASAELIQLAETWQAPIVTALPARGLLPLDHPLALGGLGQGGTDAAQRALHEADVIFTIATNWWPEQYVPRPAQATVIRLDAVAANIGLDSPVDIALVGDAAAVLPRLREKLQAVTEPSWPETVAGWKAAALQQLTAASAAVPTSDAGAVPPAQTMQVLGEVLPPEAIVTLDTGDHTVWFNRAFTGRCQRVLVSGTWRSLGFGVSAALAARLCQRQHPVVAIVGDGGISSLLGELLTVAQLALPLVIIVMRNDMYAMEYHGMVSQGLQPLGTDLNNPDFVKLAHACGLQASKVASSAALPQALRDALASEQPMLLEVMTVPEALPGPKS